LEALLFPEGALTVQVTVNATFQGELSFGSVAS
jgi:hypothetical protein